MDRTSNKPAEILEEHIEVMRALHRLTPTIHEVAIRMARCLEENGTIYWMGNGGSAADSQHLAAEFVGRFQRERNALPSIALTANTSTLTAVANDYGFESVFSRQVEALCAPADVVCGISTSGKSPNVVNAMYAARRIGAYTIGLGGGDGGDLVAVVDQCILVPSRRTARIQEAHILVGHMLCEVVEGQFSDIRSD